MELIETGKIVNTHGIHGDVKVLSWAQSPEDLLNIKTFYINAKPYEVENSRIHKDAVLIKFVGITNMDDAEKLKNKIIYADKLSFDLKDDEYFIQDIIGMTVIDIDSGKEYGTITDVLATGANDVYVITSETKQEILIPAIPECIISTDTDNKIMKIHAMDGLFDEDKHNDEI